MVKVTSLTFVIGAAASEAVLHQLRHSPVSWDVYRSPAGQIGESIERRLIASPLAFELEDDVRRLVWRSSDSSCGILYIVQADQLKTINLFLGGATSVESLEMCQLAAAFDSIGYGKCLAMIDSVPRPLIASFHCAGGGVDRRVETALLTFAAVFFESRRGISADSDAIDGVTNSLMPGYDARADARRL